MGEVLEVRCDDDDERDFAGPPTAGWRVAAGLGIVVVLVLVVSASLFGHGSGRSTRPRVQAAQADPARALALDATKAALAAWGRFATTGDLDSVRPYFAADGPQFARFQDEVDEHHAFGGPVAYAFAAQSLEVGAPLRDGERVVRTAVTVTRPGEYAQRFDWELVVRQDADGGWRVWTVRDRATEPRPGPPGPPTP